MGRSVAMEKTDEIQPTVIGRTKRQIKVMLKNFSARQSEAFNVCLV
jgi:hypothetical protein